MRINNLDFALDFSTTGTTVVTGITESLFTGSTHYELPTAKAVVDYIIGGGGVAGNDTEIQFNDGGDFGASANFVYNDTSKAITIGVRTGATGIYSQAFGANIQSNGQYAYGSGRGFNYLNPIISSGEASFNHSYRSGSSPNVSGATGMASAILGGANNSVINSYSTIIGGSTGIVSGGYSSIISSENCTVANNYSVMLGCISRSSSTSATTYVENLHIFGDINKIPYKSYVGLLAQNSDITTGDTSLTATTLYNDIGVEPTLSYNGIGDYIITFSNSGLTLNKTYITIGNVINSGALQYPIISIAGDALSTTSIEFFTFDPTTELNSDNVLLNTPIEIRIYN